MAGAAVGAMLAKDCAMLSHWETVPAFRLFSLPGAAGDEGIEVAERSGTDGSEIGPPR